MRVFLVLAALSTAAAAPTKRPTQTSPIQPPAGVKVFVPPDIRYWAYGNANTTIYDDLGLPWFCYTIRQTHCIPLFAVPEGFATTRRPFTATAAVGGDDEKVFGFVFSGREWPSG